MLTQVKVRISDSDCNLVLEEVRPMESTRIDEEHETLSLANPTCFVNFTWGNPASPCFICGVRRGQWDDEERLDKGEITWEEFNEKWFKSTN